jgi:hypothetical protein
MLASLKKWPLPGSRGDASKGTGGKVTWSSADFPNLHPGNHRVTGSTNNQFNCIAWAAGHSAKWWDPNDPEQPEVEHFRPANVPRDYKVTSVVMAYESVGFIRCADGSSEDGVEKIGINADGEEYLHAARQLDNGTWTSKMGRGVVIQHDAPENLVGPGYGQGTVFMKRPL